MDDLDQVSTLLILLFPQSGSLLKNHESYHINSMIFLKKHYAEFNLKNQTLMTYLFHMTSLLL